MDYIVKCSFKNSGFKPLPEICIDGFYISVNSKMNNGYAHEAPFTSGIGVIRGYQIMLMVGRGLQPISGYRWSIYTSSELIDTGFFDSSGISILNIPFNDNESYSIELFETFI